jgi:hypothetical protein
MNLERRSGATGRRELRRTTSTPHTLVRKIELFDVDNVHCHTSALLHPGARRSSSRSLVARRHMPDHVPPQLALSREVDERTVRVEHAGEPSVLFPDRRRSRVSCAGQVPTGFDPGALYPSRSHPRGLQLTVFGASDAVRSVGIDLDSLKQTVAPDEFAVYSGSAMGQLDAEGYGGLLQNPPARQAPDLQERSPGPLGNAGRLHQRLRARLGGRHRRHHRRLRHLPVRGAPGCGRHPRRTQACGAGGQRRGTHRSPRSSRATG